MPIALTASPVTKAALSRPADDHLAGVDADPQLERRLEPAEHRQRRVERALGVVLEGGRGPRRRP